MNLIKQTVPSLTTYLKIETLGKKICEYLDSAKIPLTGDEDGRLESLKCEEEVTNRMREQFPHITFLEKGRNRDFGDITPVIDEVEYPINVKMINPTKSGSYNGGGPKTFNYVLYGQGNTTWNRLAKKIKHQKPQKCTKPYYYLIYYKNSPIKTVFCSLANISENSVITNPSNPIQLKKNIETVERTDLEQVQFIVNLFTDCARKRAQAYLILSDTTQDVA